jgi:hypothetical protein
MKRLLLLLMSMVLLIVGAMPASAGTTSLDGPDPAVWLSGDDQRGPVVGSSGTATVNENGATIKVNATGLEPGHAYTMWVVYFNDSLKCDLGCNGADLPVAGGAVTFGNGQVAGGSGNATFTARMNTGDGVTSPDHGPPPFGFALYEAGDNNEFHVVIRSHGPKIAGEVGEQIHTWGGGCDKQVGPPPENPLDKDFPVPAAPRECGDVQLYVFK